MDDEKKSRARLISELKALRQKVAETGKLYRTIVETNLYGIQEIDIYGHIIYMNSVHSGILGYEDGKLKNSEIWDLLASDSDRKDLTEHLTRLSHGKNAPHIWSGKFFKSEGDVIKLHVNWTSRRNEKGQIVGFVAVTTEVSGYNIALEPIAQTQDRMDQTQAWMTGKENKYALIAECAREMILVFDMEGKITYVNESGLETIGYFEEELTDMNISDFLPPDQIERIKKELLEKHEKKDRDLIIHKAEFINRNLKLLPMEISLSLILKMGKASEILIIARDMSCQ